MRFKRSILLQTASLAVMMHPQSASAQEADRSGSSQADEIVVTATRRAETVLEIPYNISAVSGDTLEKANITDLAGLRNSTPGLIAVDYGPRANGSNNNFIIRGVSTDAIGGGGTSFPKLGSSATSTYIDDIPVFANLKLSDIARVEVLRGPQGTLFGAGSVGGTIRLIRNRPDIGKFDYEANLAASTTRHAGKAGYDADAMLNVPIGSTLALRLNGGYEYQAGIINATNAYVYDKDIRFNPDAQVVLANPASPLTSPAVTRAIKDIDWAKIWFARAALRWQPTDAVDIEASYLHQNTKANAFPFRTGTSGYENRQLIPVSPIDTDTDLASLTGTVDFGFATLTSATSYSRSRSDDLYDNSQIANAFIQYYGNYPRASTTNYDIVKDRSFVQELRLVSKDSDTFEYVIGGYYQNRKQSTFAFSTVPGLAAYSTLPGSGVFLDTYANDVVLYFGGVRPGTLNPPDTSFTFDRQVRFEELAGFGEFTWHATPALSFTGGARIFNQKFRQSTVQTFPTLGFFGGDGASSDPAYLANGTSQGSGSRSETKAIFKGNASYEFGDQLAYFTFSQGFRSGGANAYPIGPRSCPACDPGTFLNYGPDSANNYEFGIKGRLLDRAISYSLAAFRIDWQDIQIEIASRAGTPTIVNGGRARSQGIEFEAQVRPTSMVTASISYAYTDAKTTEVIGPIAFGGRNFIAPSGTRLPGSARHQVGAAIDISVPLGSNKDRTIDFHADVNWRSDVLSSLDPNSPGFARLDGFAMTNMSVAYDWSSALRMQIFVTNVFDVDGISAKTAGNNLAPPNIRALYRGDYIARPRTVGIRLTLRQ
ncbi:TonB-dependent receptor [Novosphingobium sp. AAP93]|uniref:TonB-dependent receptor n=1 Tax=Novosphingobium sp. AAP93 TaxID=1523427 RepID=UPI000B2B6A49|nr:TonB-dependent receptor [Novosphingobium sp. AAP93]